MTRVAEDRRYFTVLDEDGRAMPAVEYWAGYFDQAQPVNDIVPLRRFIKLLWSGEPLGERGEGMFVGQHSGRRYFALSGERREAG